MTSENKKYTALIIGITIVIMLWTAHFFAFFNQANGFSYDLLMRSYPSSKASEKVIVIEMDSNYADRGDEVWLRLLEQLLKYDVNQIAFTFLPEQASSQFYQLAVDSGKTVFGVHVIKNQEYQSWVMPPLPKAVGDKEITFGLVSAVPNQDGVFREQHSVINANGLDFSGFEKRVAEQVLDKTVVLPEVNFRVNFVGNQDRIPRIRIQRVLSGGLVGELVSGRTVLVGVNSHEILSQYYTPISTEGILTSEVMFHAFALDTLLSDRQISILDDWVVFLLILLITGISLFQCQWLSFQTSLLVSMVVTLAFIVITWLMLQVINIWVPLVELLLAEWLSFSMVWRYRVTQESDSLDQMLLGLSEKLREKVLPVSFYRTEEPWEQLIAMINQSLSLNRMIFLERVEGDHRLKEIKALNCGIEDIKEVRRDYERTPYSIAISENKPILLEKVYLKEVEIEELQYLAPLIFAGEILGFWAFTIEPDKLSSQVKFNTLTNAFMVQISEILHYRQEWQKQVQREDNKLWSYLRVEGGAESFQQLNQSVAVMEKRVSELQEVFNSINTSCIVYDLFGRVLLVNNDMEEFAQKMSLRLFNMTMLEFIVETGGYDEVDARNILQKVIFDHEQISVPVVHAETKRSYMLRLRPLDYKESKSTNELIPEEGDVFQMSGVLCELVDMTELRSLYQLKEQMFERFSFQVRNDLSSILYALPMLDDQSSTLEDRQFVLTNIQDKVDETLNMMDLVKQQMMVEIEQMLSNKLICYPVDGRVPLQRVIEELKEKIERREIKVHVQIPELISLVFAAPLELETVLHAVMLAMIEDTYEGGEIWVKVEEEDQNVFYLIHNKGIGISDDKLEQFQVDEARQESEIIKFHYAIRCINRWGGSLNLKSQMGEGTKAELLLRRFM